MLLLADVAASHAQVPLPPVNLGDTAIRDGIGGPGGLIEHALSHYRAERVNDRAGGKVAEVERVDVAALVTHIAWLTEKRILGANWGFEALLPVVTSETTRARGLQDTRSGIGDLTISGMILQWPARSVGGGRLWQRLNLALTLPTGEYDSGSDVNVGANAWAFNPHYAFTWESPHRWEISGRIHYLWPGENRRPPSTIAQRCIQAGDAVHLNASLSYALSDGVHVGIASYALKQVSDDRIDNRAVPGSRETVIGFGPALQFRSRFGDLSLNGYIEAAARNRAEGAKLLLRWSRSFAASGATNE